LMKHGLIQILLNLHAHQKSLPYFPFIRTERLKTLQD